MVSKDLFYKKKSGIIASLPVINNKPLSVFKHKCLDNIFFYISDYIDRESFKFKVGKEIVLDKEFDIPLEQVFKDIPEERTSKAIEEFLSLSKLQLKANVFSKNLNEPVSGFYNVFSYIVFENKDVFHIKFTTDLMKYLITTKMFALINRTENLKLVSKGSYKLFQLLEDYKNLGYTGKLDLNLLMDFFDVSYSRFIDFYRFSLKPAIEEINSNTSLDVYFSLEDDQCLFKTNGEISHVKFFISEGKEVNFVLSKKQEKLLKDTLKNVKGRSENRLLIENWKSILIDVLALRIIKYYIKKYSFEFIVFLLKKSLEEAVINPQAFLQKNIDSKDLLLEFKAGNEVVSSIEDKNLIIAKKIYFFINWMGKKTFTKMIIEKYGSVEKYSSSIEACQKIISENATEGKDFICNKILLLKNKEKDFFEYVNRIEEINYI